MWNIALCAVLSFACVEGSFFKIRFPSSIEIFPRLILKGHFPSLSEFTLCTWIRPHSFQKEYSTFFSYATHRSNNEYAGCLSNRSGTIKVGINIIYDYLEFDCSQVIWEVGEWYHVCASWFGFSGQLKIYVNSKQCTANDFNDVDVLSAGNTIQSGGIFVMGQDQDSLDEEYDAYQSWTGDIADMNLWNFVMNEDQIREASKCHKKNKGNVIAGLKTPMIAIHTVISETEFCYFI